MQLTSPRVATIATLFFAGLAANAHAAETLKLDLSSQLNEATSNEAAPGPVQSSVLAADQPYVITVSGTGSVWPAEAYNENGTCGIAEAQPAEPTPGRINAPASWDAATVFASPVRSWIGPLGRACQAVNLPVSANADATRPQTEPGFEVAVGPYWNRLTPVGGIRQTPRVDHTYSYQVNGRGVPARFRFQDRPAIDNSGVLTITVRTAAECTAVNCLGAAGPGADTVVPTPGSPVTPGAPGSTPGGTPGGTPGTGGGTGGGDSSSPAPKAAPTSIRVTGQRACTSGKVLTVRLTQPQGVEFKKAVYYVNAKKKRTVGSKAMYLKRKGKTPVLKAQKFRGLPSKTLKLRIEITTTRNQKLSVRGTVAPCTSSKKARKISVA